MVPVTVRRRPDDVAQYQCQLSSESRRPEPGPWRLSHSGWPGSLTASETRSLSDGPRLESARTGPDSVGLARRESDAWPVTVLTVVLPLKRLSKFRLPARAPA